MTVGTTSNITLTDTLPLPAMSRTVTLNADYLTTSDNVIWATSIPYSNTGWKWNLCTNTTPTVTYESTITADRIQEILDHGSDWAIINGDLRHKQEIVDYIKSFDNDVKVLKKIDGEWVHVDAGIEFNDSTNKEKENEKLEESAGNLLNFIDGFSKEGED